MVPQRLYCKESFISVYTPVGNVTQGPSPQGAGFYKVVLRISYMAACCTVVFVYVSVFTNEFTITP